MRICVDDINNNLCPLFSYIDTQRYVVTFKTFGSFLEAPGWKSGDLAFSFRTTKSSAILLFQPLLHAQHNSFSVFLSNSTPNF